MEYYIGLRSLVAVQHEPTGAWYPTFIIAKGRDSHRTFYCIVWAEMPLNEHCAEAVVIGDYIKYHFLCPASAAAT
eukprot:10762109-Ditylum_brightwellii.AAC.1